MRTYLYFLQIKYYFYPLFSFRLFCFVEKEENSVYFIEGEYDELEEE